MTSRSITRKFIESNVQSCFENIQNSYILIQLNKNPNVRKL